MPSNGPPLLILHWSYNDRSQITKKFKRFWRRANAAWLTVDQQSIKHQSSSIRPQPPPSTIVPLWGCLGECMCKTELENLLITLLITLFLTWQNNGKIITNWPGKIITNNHTIFWNKIHYCKKLTWQISLKYLAMPTIPYYVAASGAKLPTVSDWSNTKTRHGEMWPCTHRSPPGRLAWRERHRRSTCCCYGTPLLPGCSRIYVCVWVYLYLCTALGIFGWCSRSSIQAWGHALKAQAVCLG